jgi:hypothetical protein
LSKTAKNYDFDEKDEIFISFGMECSKFSKDFLKNLQYIFKNIEKSPTFNIFEHQNIKKLSF